LIKFALLAYIHFPYQIRITNSTVQIDIELPRTQPEGDGLRTLPVTLTGLGVVCATIALNMKAKASKRRGCRTAQENLKGRSTLRERKAQVFLKESD